MQDELILGAYKEPLRKVENGFGYMGAISLSKDGRIQCHICGELFDNLSFHVKTHSKITVREYKEKFGLSMSTSLVSESVRQKMKEKMFEINARHKDGFFAEMSRKGVLARKGKRTSRRESLEKKNLKGTCPDQLLEKIRECATALGYTPSYDNFFVWAGTQRFYRPIVLTFGSWSNAIKQAGLARHKHPGGKGDLDYADDELLEYLHDFYTEHSVIPSRSDYARGLFPHYTTYVNRFGSMAEARRRAGIPDWETHLGRRKSNFLLDRTVKI